MSSDSLMHTVFFFLVALAVLIAFHEFGHFYACRKLGVKVLRFSIGIGKSIWRYRPSPSETEFSIGVLPLGGYVKMVDEREGEVAPEDLPRAFNRQPVAVRAAIVFAGPLANFLLAILLYWIVFMVGETGIKPVLGPVEQGTLAATAGFEEGEEILAVGDVTTPTWSLAIGEIIDQSINGASVSIEVRTEAGVLQRRLLNLPGEVLENPESMLERLGFQPWQPSLPPVVDRVEPNSAAKEAGLQSGDRFLTMDGSPVKNWRQFADHVRANPGKSISLTIDRSGAEIAMSIIPRSVESPQGPIGRIGAGAVVPQDLMATMQVKYRLDFLPAFAAAIEKTWNYSAMTLKMIGRMLIGQASVDNLSGPISIAQYAGQSASMGWLQFLKFLAIVSISLGVLNLLPIPVLDGGHLMFFLFEGIRGKPISEATQAMFQNIGIVILFSLMIFSFYLDLIRHPS